MYSDQKLGLQVKLSFDEFVLGWLRPGQHGFDPGQRRCADFKIKIFVFRLAHLNSFTMSTRSPRNKVGRSMG